jgi:hypothetical protein
LKPYVREWHRGALPNIRTKPFEETWFDFAEAWEKVKFPAGAGAMDMIFANAMQAEFPEEGSLKEHRAHRYRYRRRI